jgi:hypothetical protein
MKKPPPKQEARSINVKKISSAGQGHVKAIRQGSEYGPENLDDGLAEITIHHGPKPKAGKSSAISKSSYDHPSPKRSTVHVSADQAKNLKIGQKVRVHLEHC